MKKLLTIALALTMLLGTIGAAQAKTIVVGHDTNFMPFEFKDPDTEGHHEGDGHDH